MPGPADLLLMGSRVPVVGQPTLGDFLIVLGFTCSCEAKQVLTVGAKPNAIFGCGACKRTWQVQSLKVDEQFNIQLKMAQVKVQGA